MKIVILYGDRFQCDEALSSHSDIRYQIFGATVAVSHRVTFLNNAEIDYSIATCIRNNSECLAICSEDQQVSVMSLLAAKKHIEDTTPYEVSFRSFTNVTRIVDLEGIEESLKNVERYLLGIYSSEKFIENQLG
jgi:hypothetical protein